MTFGGPPHNDRERVREEGRAAYRRGIARNPKAFGAWLDGWDAERARIGREGMRERIDAALAKARADGHLWEYESFASGYEACWLDQFPPTP